MKLCCYMNRACEQEKCIAWNHEYEECNKLRYEELTARYIYEIAMRY